MNGCWQKGHALSFGAPGLPALMDDSAFEPGVPDWSAILC